MSWIRDRIAKMKAEGVPMKVYDVTLIMRHDFRVEAPDGDERGATLIAEDRVRGGFSTQLFGTARER